MSAEAPRRPTDVLVARLASFGDAPAMGGTFGLATYSSLESLCGDVEEFLQGEGVSAGDRVLVVSDHSPEGAACILALAHMRATAIPVQASAVAQRVDQLRDLSRAQFVLTAEPGGGTAGLRVDRVPGISTPDDPALLVELRERGVAGMILFTSGSSGEPKVVVHDLDALLSKFVADARPVRTVSVLLFDHWGGLNTMFRVLGSGGFIACPESRRPEEICSLVERYQLDLLPASPSFLNMLLVTGADQAHDLSSLRTVTYGAEPMPATLLARLVDRFPDLRFQQTYGLVELGVMSSRSRDRGSLMMTIGGDGYEYRVVDGLLEIKARSSMLGYLNAPSPFTDDGFFRTGDRVEVDGEYIRVLGRESEMINVGGEKVLPTEVEAVLIDIPGVNDAVVYGESHPLLGQIVCADVVLGDALDAADARRVIRRACADRLPAYQVPAKVKAVEGPLVNDRQKRVRPRPRG
jgi:long-chain acyl-CoA synthetase